MGLGVWLDGQDMTLGNRQAHISKPREHPGFRNSVEVGILPVPCGTVGRAANAVHMIAVHLLAAVLQDPIRSGTALLSL